ncbi:MAG: sulfotransferase family 2 domain-containing protein [Pseudomonadota bacterium]
MIVSHKHKFIFVKNRKVGGTSMEVALAKICGPDDILSSDVPERGRVGRNDVLAAHARNYEGGFNVFGEMKLDMRPGSVARVLRDRLQRHRYYSHMRAASIKARIGAQVWDSYYTFCFERNPWDKMISFYYWYNRLNQDPVDINTFICGKMAGRTVDQKYPTDWDRYTLQDRIITDDVFDFSDLSGNLATALGRAGVAPEIIASLELPRAKTHTRAKEPEKLTKASDAVVRKVFANEIRQFGYTPPEGLTGA